MYYDTGKYLVKKYCSRKTENKYYFIFLKLCRMYKIVRIDINIYDQKDNIKDT